MGGFFGARLCSASAVSLHLTLTAGMAWIGVRSLPPVDSQLAHSGCTAGCGRWGIGAKPRPEHQACMSGTLRCCRPVPGTTPSDIEMRFVWTNIAHNVHSLCDALGGACRNDAECRLTGDVTMFGRQFFSQKPAVHKFGGAGEMVMGMGLVGLVGWVLHLTVPWCRNLGSSCSAMVRCTEINTRGCCVLSLSCQTIARYANRSANTVAYRVAGAADLAGCCGKECNMPWHRKPSIAQLILQDVLAGACIDKVEVGQPHTSLPRCHTKVWVSNVDRG
jgi:hypothetical protein